MSVMFEFEVGRERYRVTRSTPARTGATKILVQRLVAGSWEQAGEGAGVLAAWSLALEGEHPGPLARASPQTYPWITKPHHLAVSKNVPDPHAGSSSRCSAG